MGNPVSDRSHNRFAIVGGTAVDFGTAHVIHRSSFIPPTAHRSYQAKPALSLDEHDSNPQKLLFGASSESRLAMEDVAGGSNRIGGDVV